tara:strand:- start:268 stop:474 length:207 start_codon:yes stop_codon:yes gene_type:complete
MRLSKQLQKNQKEEPNTNMITRKTAIEILAMHGEIPHEHLGRYDMSFDNEVGIKDTYTIKEVFYFLGY